MRIAVFPILRVYGKKSESLAPNVAVGNIHGLKAERVSSARSVDAGQP